MNGHIKKKLENLAEAFNKSVENVLALFEYASRKISEESGKKEPDLSVSAFHAVRAHLTTEKGQVGKEINVVFLGKDASRDTNAKIRGEILEAFWNNPESRKEAIESGKIMLLQIKKGDPNLEFHEIYKPIVTMEDSVEVDGETVPTKGEAWDPTKNTDPICRDYRETLDEEGERKNWNYSRPLKENWKTTLFGLGYFEDTPDIVKKIQIRFFGDAGDPKSGQFVIKHIKFGRNYKLKVVINEKLSGEDCYVLNAKTKPVFAGEPGEDLNVTNLLEGYDDPETDEHSFGINEQWAMQLSAKGKEPQDLIPIVDFADLKKWHAKRRARKDDDGNIIKSEKGWDFTNWDEYCLIDQCTYLGKRQYKNNYEPAVIQHDSTGKETFNVDYDDDLDMEIPVPSDILICVKTGRGTSKYDREAKATIQDAEDPDLKITICGYKTLTSYEKIVFPKELTGDL